MTQEEKILLLKDLCARLPYETIVSVDNGKYREDMKLRPYHIADFNNWNIKPYLRLMSSMTEEEESEYNLIQGLQHWMIEDGMIQNYGDAIDWLNAHHFDYRGLIEMGLALEAPEGMYKIN